MENVLPLNQNLQLSLVSSHTERQVSYDIPSEYELSETISKTFWAYVEMSPAEYYAVTVGPEV